MQTTRFGRDGETAAEKYLEGKGYHFLALWRTEGSGDALQAAAHPLYSESLRVQPPYRKPAHPFRRRRSHADGGWDCEV